MSDDRPSIAELQRLCRDESANHDVELADATPVLLEIAAAALAIQAWHDCDGRSQIELWSRLDALITATRKVRP